MLFIYLFIYILFIYILFICYGQNTGNYSGQVPHYNVLALLVFLM